MTNQFPRSTESFTPWLLGIVSGLCVAGVVGMFAINSTVATLSERVASIIENARTTSGDLKALAVKVETIDKRLTEHEVSTRRPTQP